MKLVKDTDNKLNENKQISDKDAEEAFKTILTWMGEDPNREGLLETPKRVVKAFKEYFKGYKEDPNQILDKTFGDVDVDGTGEAWEYMDSWAYKVEGAWTYGGVDCTDGSTTKTFLIIPCVNSKFPEITSVF